MSTESFQFRYPLSVEPRVADQHSPIIYPYSRWGDFATNPHLYVYGRPLDFRSYYGEDLNLSARPITRVIQPTVLEYDAIPPLAAVQQPSFMGQPEAASACNLIVGPAVLNNRFAALGAAANEAGLADATISNKSGHSTRILLLLLLVLFFGAIINREKKHMLNWKNNKTKLINKEQKQNKH